MVGGLAGVTVSLMGTRRCSPTETVWVGEYLQINSCVYFNAECQMSGVCLKTLPEIPETVDSCKIKEVESSHWTFPELFQLTMH